MSEDKIILREEQIKLIEELAHLQEGFGHSPAVSKIMALLTVSDETELTFDQIRNTLELSKGAVSQGLNMLLSIKQISYKAKLGSRKRTFFLLSNLDNHWIQLLEGIKATSDVYKKILAIRPDSTKEFNENLKRSNEFLEFAYNQTITYYAQKKGS